MRVAPDDVADVVQQTRHRREFLRTLVHFQFAEQLGAVHRDQRDVTPAVIGVVHGAQRAIGCVDEAEGFRVATQRLEALHAAGPSSMASAYPGATSSMASTVTRTFAISAKRASAAI